MPPRFVLLLDGGFVIRKLKDADRCFPDADRVEALSHRIVDRCRSELGLGDLLRIYFYHARPATADIVNPLDGARESLAKTRVARDHESLIDRLEVRPDFAVRLGETSVNDWRLGSAAIKNLRAGKSAIQARDLVPNISQKGVDLRIGLDMARLALRPIAQSIAVVSGDSDLVPAFKFARREGQRLLLWTLGHGVKREMYCHADRVVALAINEIFAS